MSVGLNVDHLSGDTYRVRITDAKSGSTHDVTIDTRPISGVPDEDLVRASVLFLLDREPKESILRRFDLSVIPRYFPEYEARIGDYL